MKSTCVNIVGVLLLSFLCLCAPDAHSFENSDCLICHDDTSLTGEKNGQTVSLYVNEEEFDGSVHGGFGCTDCHADLDGAELPHDTPLKPVNCGECHEQEQKKFADSLHGRAFNGGDPLAPGCSTCHGNHAIVPVQEEGSPVSNLRIPFLCGSCHQEGSAVQVQRHIPQDHIIQNYSQSIHGEGLFKKGLSVTATCISCHSSHEILPHTDPRSTISQKNIVNTCLKCHSQIEAVHRKVISGELWQKDLKSIPVCVECHQPHKIRKVFYDQGVADRDCLSCHSKADIKASGDGRSLFVDYPELNNSIHAKVSCAQCHFEVTPSLSRACETIKSRVNCAVCHTEQVEDYQKSIHGQLFAKNDPNAPTCKECHGEHGILGKADSASMTFPTNVPTLCARCHREGQKAAVRYQGSQHDIPHNYTESIHGKGLLKSGLVVTAMCTNCHSAHKILPSADPESSVNRANVALTCSQCHKGVYEKYYSSVHGPGYDKKKGDGQLPECIDCHTAHTIKRTDQDKFRFEIMNVCGKCHEGIAKTYFETFHGKVSKLGYAKTAKCHDCHGAHNILPTVDSHSTLSRQNIVQTCQQCHPGASRQFAGYLTHATHHDPHKYPWIFWTFWIMTSLLVGTFVISGVHTLLWLPRSLQMRRAHPPKKYDPGELQYVRFKLLHRILHAVMIVSFLTLAMTGMILKFSYAGWAQFASRVLGGFGVSGFLHRIAALTLITIFIIHLVDLVRRKRKDYGSWKAMIFGPDTMLFTLTDLRQIVQSIKWYLGIGPRPQYGRWTYWEKFDYFAVFWGIFVIGFSGLILWFPELFTKFLPGWAINVATIVHSDEALLAAGFIFTVHFFNTHFRPEKFPMDTVIFTGRMPLEELKRERPAEYTKLVESGELHRHLAAPLPPAAMRTIRIFAWAALIIGLTLTVGIIYAMLFTYK